MTEDEYVQKTSAMGRDELRRYLQGIDREEQRRGRSLTGAELDVMLRRWEDSRSRRLFGVIAAVGAAAAAVAGVAAVVWRGVRRSSTGPEKAKAPARVDPLGAPGRAVAKAVAEASKADESQGTS